MARGAGSPTRWRGGRGVCAVGTGAVLAVMILGLSFLNSDLTTGNMFRGDVDSVEGQKLLERGFSAGTNAPTNVLVTNRAKVERRARGAGPGARRRRRLGQGRAGSRRGEARGDTRQGSLQHGRVRPDPRDPRSSARGRRRAGSGGWAVGRGVRPAPFVRARQPLDRADRADRRVPDPGGAAAGGHRATDPDRDGRRVVLRRARGRGVLLRERVRLPGHGPGSAAVRVHLPGRARRRLQHLPHGARARGDARARHAHGDRPRPRGDRCGDHIGRARARRAHSRRWLRCRSWR